jgi:hypothetical protein
MTPVSQLLVGFSVMISLNDRDDHDLISAITIGRGLVVLDTKTDLRTKMIEKCNYIFVTSLFNFISGYK